MDLHPQAARCLREGWGRGGGGGGGVGSVRKTRPPHVCQTGGELIIEHSWLSICRREGDVGKVCRAFYALKGAGLLPDTRKHLGEATRLRSVQHSSGLIVFGLSVMEPAAITAVSDSSAVLSCHGARHPCSPLLVLAPPLLAHALSLSLLLPCSLPYLLINFHFYPARSQSRPLNVPVTLLTPAAHGLR